MILFEFDHNSSTNLYVQLYKYLSREITSGRITAGERLPSLRSMADQLGASITTIRLAYDQLLVEGYLISKPNSGYYAAEGAGSTAIKAGGSGAGDTGSAGKRQGSVSSKAIKSFDPTSFDFAKWRKCMAEVLGGSPEALLTEGDRQGEPVLRKEIADYLYRSRGVVCGPDQVVISAGTQQLVTHLARILKRMGISLVCTEDPGYLPVRNIFHDRGFSISDIPVRQDGVEIEKLPVNIRSAVYVSPQNQFPTGAVMPISRRHQILEWAAANDSVIIEDDYDSELRYFGRPIPALQGLDSGSRVVYTGSFSSTLFPAVRISYMVLPESMLEIYERIKTNYDQTCSKTEQLTLAEFMSRGYYQTNLRKIRKLYSRKLQLATKAIHESDPEGSFITAVNTQSGINIILKVNTHAATIALGSEGEERASGIRRELAQRIVSKAECQGVQLRSIDQLDHEGELYIMFRYNQIPAESIGEAVKELLYAVQTSLTMGSRSMPSVYEVMRIRSGEPVFLEEHYERLLKSLGSIGLTASFTCEELAKMIKDAEGSESNASLGDHNLRVEVDITGHSAIYMVPAHYPNDKQYKEGVTVGLLRGERRNPNIKMLDHELRDAADRAIRENAFYEVLLVDRNGRVTEGSRSNVFFIRGNRLITPPSDQVLLGVTRGKILEIARDIGAEIIEEAPDKNSLGDYDAAFISGTSPGVLPVSLIRTGPGSGASDVVYDAGNDLLRKIKSIYDTL